MYYLAILYQDRWIKGHFRLIVRKIINYLAIWYLDRLTKGHYRFIDRKIVNYLAIWYQDRWIKGHYRLIDRKIVNYLAIWYQDRWVEGYYRLVVATWDITLYLKINPMKLLKSQRNFFLRSTALKWWKELSWNHVVFFCFM